MGVVVIARMMEGFRDRQIGVMQFCIFADQPDLHTVVPGPADAFHHLPPFPEVRFRRLQAQLPADDIGKAGLLQHERRLIKDGQSPVLDHAVLLHIAEHGDLLHDGGIDRGIAAQDDEIRVDPHPLQLLDRMLGRLGFVLTGSLQIGHQGHMDKKTVLLSDLQGDLADGLDKGLRLDIADGPPDLCDNYIRTGLFADTIDKVLDLIGDVGDHLDRGAQILPFPLLIQNIPVDLAGRQVRILIEVFVNKALIVAQVKVCLRTVLGHKDLPVLIRTHRPRIHIDIGIQLLRGHLQPPRLQKPAQGGCRNALSQAGDHTAGHENILCHFVYPFCESV